MPPDDPQQQGDEHAGSDHSGDKVAEPIMVTTTDPAIDDAYEHPSDWKAQPDSTLCVETTQAHEPNPLYIGGVRQVVSTDQAPRQRRQDNQGEPSGDRNGGHGDGRHEDHDQGAESGKNQEGRRQGTGDGQKGGQAHGKGQEGEQKASHDSHDNGHDRQHDRSDHRNQPQAQNQPSLMKNLLVTAGVAAICGLVGAVGYSYFFGSESGKNSSDPSQGKSQSSSSSSGSGGSKQDSDQGKSHHSDAGSKAMLAAATNEVNSTNQQLVDLMVRVDRLSERVDKMVRPHDQATPLLQSVQTEIAEIYHELDTFAAMTTKVRDLDRRLATALDEMKSLRMRLDALTTGPAASLAATVALPETAAARAPVAVELGPPSTSMERGISMLEQGQYESARNLFEQLTRKHPLDARVWYYAAIAVGLASGDWNDEARELAEKGVERERAGSPPAAEVDAALNTSTPIKGKAWLNGLRQRSLTANRTP